jgi:phosphatidylethanolamine-binding protein (PEBP) family uncharacterized protein
MSRIRIDDLPVAETLTPEQEELIQGAGLKSFRPSLEALEDRCMPAVIAPGIDLTDTTLTFNRDASHYNSGANVWINDANQVVAQRTHQGKVGPAVFLDESQVTRIVYVGGDAKDTFRNNTNILSSFTNLYQEQGDVHTSGLNSERPPDTTRGFNVTSSTFTGGGFLPDSSAEREAKRGGLSIGGNNEAPPLEWTAHPSAQSYAVVTKDISVPGENPSAPKGTHIHQALYNIPKDKLSLSTNEARSTGEGYRFRGPNPPDGNPHTYVTTVYALRTANLNLEGMTPEQMEEAIKAQSVGQTSISGKLQADVRPDVWNAEKNDWK